jgi:hypothetical protein
LGAAADGGFPQWNSNDTALFGDSPERAAIEAAGWSVA